MLFISFHILVNKIQWAGYQWSLRDDQNSEPGWYEYEKDRNRMKMCLTFLRSKQLVF